MRYELQVLRPGKSTAFREDGFTTTATQFLANLEGIVSALRRVKDGNRIPVTIVCNGAVSNMLSSGRYLVWEGNDWKTAKGEPVAYMEMWKEISGLLHRKTTEVRSRNPATEDGETMDRLSGKNGAGKTA